MAKFRKKPVVIEAVQATPEFLDAPLESYPQWFGDAFKKTQIRFLKDPQYTAVLNIETLEGVMTAELNDWIIQGVKGEIYPCKPDIFAATYEPA